MLITDHYLGRTLEETAVLFDGEEKPAEMEHVAGEAATITMDRTRHGLGTNVGADVASLFSTASVSSPDEKVSSAISSNHTVEVHGLSSIDSWARRPSSSGYKHAFAL
jgi:hypothetical protein